MSGARRKEVTPGQSGRASLAVLAVFVAVLLAGLVTWWRSTHRATEPPSVPAAPEEAIGLALGAAEPDSTAIKTKWVETVPDLDLTALDPGRRETFVRFINARFCECGCGYTLGACRNFDPTCEYSGPLVAALFDSVRAGARFDLAGLRPRPDDTRPGGGAN